MIREFGPSHFGIVFVYETDNGTNMQLYDLHKEKLILSKITHYACVHVCVKLSCSKYVKSNIIKYNDIILASLIEWRTGRQLLVTEAQELMASSFSLPCAVVCQSSALPAGLAEKGFEEALPDSVKKRFQSISDYPE